MSIKNKHNVNSMYGKMMEKSFSYNVSKTMPDLWPILFKGEFPEENCTFSKSIIEGTDPAYKYVFEFHCKEEKTTFVVSCIEPIATMFELPRIKEKLKRKMLNILAKKMKNVYMDTEGVFNTYKKTYEEYLYSQSLSLDSYGQKCFGRIDAK